MKPRPEPSPRRNLRLSLRAALLLAACSLALWSGCATIEHGRAGEDPTEERLRFFYPERDSGTPTRFEQRKIERNNHKRGSQWMIPLLASIAELATHE